MSENAQDNYCRSCDGTGVMFSIGGGRDLGAIEVEEKCCECRGSGVPRLPPAVIDDLIACIDHGITFDLTCEYCVLAMEFNAGPARD